MERGGFVYIMASRRNGTLYTGVTSDLPYRIAQHKAGTLGGFSDRYGCKLLVWFEQHDEIEAAITREKRIKEWKRLWKLRLIEEMNPQWEDLYDQLF
ncbi:GIY-YIG nuclease family protein [Novosphingobium sp.]|uniref:GIY-YIG nuclease family protein n=1 Tax=Novosphingobium sp. TaxID=1874826 RepID=UPI0035AEFEBD